MEAIRPNRAGVALGTILGGWHLLWALLVAVGVAQRVIDFVLWMHFISPVYMVGAFHAGTAALLVIVTALLGYILGFAFAAVWNAVRG